MTSFLFAFGSNECWDNSLYLPNPQWGYVHVAQQAKTTVAQIDDIIAGDGLPRENARNDQIEDAGAVVHDAAGQADDRHFFR
jgi:hypothetical protein